jgi:hypothetical protein
MPNFSDQGPVLYRQYQADLHALASKLGVSVTVYDELIVTEQRAMEVRKELDMGDFDLILLFHATYIIGDVVFELLKARAPMGLWALEEPQKSGPLPLASLACLNQNTSIASHFFGPGGRKVKWFFGSVAGRYFRPRFAITVAALRAVRELRDARVGQVGQIAPGFRGMYYDERAIYAALGVDVVRGIEVEDVLAEAARVDEGLVRTEVGRIKSLCAAGRVSEDKIIESARIYLALRDLCQRNNLKAVAFSCWPKLIASRNLIPCLANGLLDSAGIPVGCEGDVLSTISMLILSSLSGQPVAVMDMPAFDTEDDSLLLWHCGSAPPEMADGRGVVCRHHYRAEFAEQPDFEKLGPVMDLVYRPSDVTVFRLTGEGDRFYYFTGRISDKEKPSWQGSRGWTGELRLYGERISSIDLMNTVLVNGIQHHYPMVLQNIGPSIEEFAYWIGLKKVARVEYRDYLSV